MGLHLFKVFAVILVRFLERKEIDGESMVEGSTCTEGCVSFPLKVMDKAVQNFFKQKKSVIQETPISCNASLRENR